MTSNNVKIPYKKGESKPIMNKGNKITMGKGKFLNKEDAANAPKPAGMTKGAGKKIVRGFGLGKGKTGAKNGGFGKVFKTSVPNKAVREMKK